MKSKELASEGVARYVIVLETGEEAIDCVRAFAEERQLSGFFFGIGALREARTAFWNAETKAYEERDWHEQLEVTSLVGNVSVATEGASPKRRVHAHVTLGRRDGTAVGGHLRRGVVYPTLELLFVSVPAGLRRSLDQRTELPLLVLD